MEKKISREEAIARIEHGKKVIERVYIARPDIDEKIKEVEKILQDIVKETGISCLEVTAHEDFSGSKMFPTSEILVEAVNGSFQNLSDEEVWVGDYGFVKEEEDEVQKA